METNDKTCFITFRLSAELRRKLVAEAARQDRPLGSLVRQLAEKGMRELEAK